MVLGEDETWVPETRMAHQVWGGGQVLSEAGRTQGEGGRVLSGADQEQGRALRAWNKVGWV